jgi:hypothetical protein
MELRTTICVALSDAKYALEHNYLATALVTLKNVVNEVEYLEDNVVNFDSDSAINMFVCLEWHTLLSRTQTLIALNTVKA